MKTLISVTGHRRGGDVELMYASFLSSGSAATQVLRQGNLRKKAESGTFAKNFYEKWNERHVTLRGNFLCVGKVNHEAQAKVHMLTAVSSNSEVGFTVASTHGRLYFRAETSQERELWVKTIQEALDHAGSLPHMEDHKLDRSSSATRRTSSNSSDASQSRHSDGPEEFAQVASAHGDHTEGAGTVPHGPASHPDRDLEFGRNSQAALKGKRAVGVFWDTTTVKAPEASEAATNKLRQFAEQRGHVVVFKAYKDEETERSVRKRIDKEMLIWLLGQSKAAAEEAVVVLVSDRAFLDTLKEFAKRGTEVIVVNSKMEKTVVSGAAVIQYQRASRTLWEPAHTSHTLAAATAQGRDRAASDSDSTSSCSPGASRAPSPDPRSSASRCPCSLEAPLREVEAATKRPAFATTFLVLANVMLAVLLVWSA